MSIETVRSIVCDKCNTHGTPSDAMPRPIRRAAKEAGWKVGKQKDFCPTCSEQMKQEIKASIEAINNQ